jgi:hypothetical protein
MSISRVPALLACLAFSGILPAAAQTDDGVEAEVDAALLNLAERGALGSFDQPLTIARPAQVRYELGAVVDVRKPDPRGIEVLAITPDGAAARMGLKAGDRLMAINDRRLDGDAAPAGVLRDAVRDGNGAVRLVAVRGKSRIELDGHTDVVAVPAYQLTVGEAAAGTAAGCGYVSDSSLPPRSEGLFKAVITQVDGRSTPLGGINRLRVAGGRHVVMIREVIPGHRLSMMQNRQRARAQQHLMARAYKPLVVDIKPDTEYRIGVRLRKDRLDYASIRDNEYWEPVVWEQRAASCR